VTDRAAVLTTELVAVDRTSKVIDGVIARMQDAKRESDALSKALADSLKAQGSGGRSSGGRAPARSSGNAEEALKLARGQASLQNATRDYEGAQRTLNGAIEAYRAALGPAADESLALVRAQTQLAQVATRYQASLAGATPLQQSITKGIQGATPNLATMGQGLLGVAGGLGLVASVGGAAVLTFGKLKEGFNLNAQLQETNAATTILLGSQQKANQVFSEAAAFGQKYKFTQQEMAQAANALAPIIAKSNSSFEQAANVSSRLASLNPAEGFQGAAFAIKELESGDYTSIAERFNLGNTATR
jgi:hypothetical protein